MRGWLGLWSHLKAGEDLPRVDDGGIQFLVGCWEEGLSPSLAGWGLPSVPIHGLLHR